MLQESVDSLFDNTKKSSSRVSLLTILGLARFSLPYSLWNGVDYANLGNLDEYHVSMVEGEFEEISRTNDENTFKFFS